MAITEIKIESVTGWIEKVDSLSEWQEHHAHKRLWFRGQTNATWALQPKVFRDDYKPTSEKDRLNLEQQASQEFHALGGINLTGQESDVELYFMEQHYGMRTRLLDWSNNPLVALWFAVGGSQCPPCKNEPVVDGAVFVFDAYSLKNLPEEFGIASPYNDLLKGAIETITKWGKVGDFPKFIIPVRPAHNIARVRQQNSFFTFHAAGEDGHTDLTEADAPSLKKYVIPHDRKAVIKETLKRLGIDAYSVYGGLDNLSTEIENSYIGRWKSKQSLE